MLTPTTPQAYRITATTPTSIQAYTKQPSQAYRLTPNNPHKHTGLHQTTTTSIQAYTKQPHKHTGLHQTTPTSIQDYTKQPPQTTGLHQTTLTSIQAYTKKTLTSIQAYTPNPQACMHSPATPQAKCTQPIISIKHNSTSCHIKQVHSPINEQSHDLKLHPFKTEEQSCSLILTCAIFKIYSVFVCALVDNIS